MQLKFWICNLTFFTPLHSESLLKNTHETTFLVKINLLILIGIVGKWWRLYTILYFWKCKHFRNHTIESSFNINFFCKTMQGEIVKFGKSIGNLKISFVVIEKYKKNCFWKLRKISKKWEFLTQKMTKYRIYFVLSINAKRNSKIIWEWHKLSKKDCFEGEKSSF